MTYRGRNGSLAHGWPHAAFDSPPPPLTTRVRLSDQDGCVNTSVLVDIYRQFDTTKYSAR
jgi:hypothetical protein